MPQHPTSPSTWARRVLSLAIAASVAACVAQPVGTTGTRPTVKSSAGTSGKSPAPASSTAPKPVPSLGLVLQGKVTVDPTAMLSGNLVKLTANGVKVTSDKGLGLISDNGLGLISDNGLGLISDNGLGVISNNAGGYRIQASGSGALRPVENMLVRAVSLFDGKVLAGPVASHADGSYKLGFLQTPERNLRIEAVLPDMPTDARYAYESLVAPTPTDIVNSDSSRAIARYILGVLPARIQPWIDSVKAGTPDAVDDDDTPYEKDLKNLLARIPADKMKAADKDGSVAMSLSMRVLSYADLGSKGYTDFYTLTEKARQLGESLKPQPEVPFVEQIMAAVQTKAGAEERLNALLVSAGMTDAEAQDYADQMMKGGENVGNLLLLVILAHEHEVFEPLEAMATIKP